MEDKELKNMVYDLAKIKGDIEYILANRENENAKKSINEVIITLEKLALKSRKYYKQKYEYKENYLKKLVNEFDVKVENIEYGVAIKMPPLMSKKKINNNDFLGEPLRYILEEFVRKNKIKKLKKCVIMFNHIYENESKVMDYDNLEIKSILDIISLFLLVDDNGKYIDLFHTTEIKDKNYLQIYLIEKEHFLKFISQKN